MNQRPDTLPYEIYYHGHPDPYLQPSQSKYHNLGMHGFTEHGKEYPGKRGGTHGDYGPRQNALRRDQVGKPGVYPLNTESKRFIQEKRD